MAKKKKRLNVKFLIVMASIVVLLGGAALAYKTIPQVKWLVRGTPASHAAVARQLFEEGKYEDAGEKYKRAIVLNRKPHPEYYTLLGDCYSHLVLEDAENIRLAKACWDQALLAEPQYLPALQRLLDLYRDDAELNRGPRAAAQWEAVHDTARKILAIDPQNRQAKALFHKAIISRWMTGVETAPERIDESLSALTALAEQPPFDADAMFVVMLAETYRGTDRVRQNDRAGATAQFAKALKLVDDTLAAHPDDARVHYRASQALRQLGAAERAPGQPPKYTDRIRAEVETAARLVKPDDDLYIEIKLALGRTMEYAGEQQSAERLYRELLEQRPDELPVRIQLAELIGRDQKRINEAISLLESAPQPDPRKYFGVRAFLAKQYQLVALSNTLNLKLDALQLLAADQTQTREQLLKEIDDGYARLISNPGVEDTPLALQIRGRSELARGENVKAVQTLDRALKLMPPISSLADIDQKYKLMFLLARANMLVNQTGEAKKLLSEIVANFEKFIPARLMLVQLLIRENDIEAAREHIKVLAKAMPDSPIVRRLQIYTLDREKDKQELAAAYARLPETNNEERGEKAQVALWMGDKPEAARLLEAVRAEVPNDLTVLGALARLYSDLGDKARSQAILNEAIAKNPDNPELKLLQARLSGQDEGEITRQLIDTISDPFQKELALFRLAVQEQRDRDAAEHLQNAARLKPDDPLVVSLLFRQALNLRDWTSAETHLETLVRQNSDQAGGLVLRTQYAMARAAAAPGQQRRKLLEEAADLALQLTQKMPEFATSYVLLGQVQQAQGRYSEAMQAYNNALRKQSQNLDAILGLIQCSYASNRLALARSYIEQGRHLFPNNVLLREMELQHELAHGDPEKVIAPRQEQLNKTPDNKRAWALLGNAYLTVARHKAGDPAAKQFLDKARDTFAQALAKWPDDISFVKAIADVAVQSKNYADGEKAIRDLQAQPQWQNKPEPTLLLADLYVQSGKPADAEKVLRSYLSANPTAIPVQLKLATVLSQAGKAEEAMKVLSESNASDPQVHKSRIELLIINKRLDEALKESNAALAGNPNPSPALLTQHAFVLMSLGRTSEALEILDRVLASNPDNVEALFYRGSLFVSARRNLDQAVRDLQTVREAMSDNVEARLYLADAYVFKDDLEAAIAELEAAVRQLPDARQPKIRLLELYAQSEPPRWRDADRVLKDARQNPRLANDIELLNAEALMWLKRKDVNKAGEVITTALKQSPNNLNLFRTYCEVLHQAKQHRELLRVTDGPVKSKQAPWWFYVYRGRALKALDDKQAALDEFSAGLEAAGADEDAATRIVQAIAEEIGVAPAKIRIASRAQKGENRWRMMMAYLCQIEPDIQQAINWTEQVINDSKSTPQEIEAAQRMLGPLYLRLDPPEVTKAVAVFQKMLERRPDDPAALNNLACTMILPNSGYTPQDALVYSQKAYDIMERAGRVEPMIHDTHGYVLVLNGRVEEGLHLLQQALEKQAFPEGYYHLGEAYLAMKVPMTTDAEQAFNQAKTLLDRAARDNQPVDLALKQKVEQALERLRQPGQAGAAQGQESAGTSAAASPDAPGAASR